ncbi:hypothetical protein ACMFMF_010133 [Clarireedia jacksonii]
MASDMDIDWAKLDAKTIEEIHAYLEANPQPPLDAGEVAQTNDDLMLGFTNYGAIWDDAVAGSGPVDQGPLQNNNKDRGHLGSHESMMPFNAPSRCTWEGCKTKTTFKTSKSYQHHLNNIHLKPLLCSVPRCSHKKPFRNRSDLQRHIDTIHSTNRPYVCPYPTCESETKRFARKDKWLQHIRETQHLNDAICPYHHCVSVAEFTSRKEISAHFSKYHSNYADDGYLASYSCSLGACAEMIDEHWSKILLINHLVNCHGIPSLGYWVAEVNGGGNKTVYSVSEKIQWHACTVCDPQNSASLLARNDPMLAALPGLRVFEDFDVVEVAYPRRRGNASSL